MACFTLLPLIAYLSTTAIPHTFSALPFALPPSPPCHDWFRVISQGKRRIAMDLILSNWSPAQHTVIMSSSETPQSPISVSSTLIPTNLAENVLVSARKCKIYIQYMKGKRVWSNLLAFFNTTNYPWFPSSSALVCFPATTHSSWSGGQQIMFVLTKIYYFVDCEIKLVTWVGCYTQQHFVVEYKLTFCFSVLSNYSE